MRTLLVFSLFLFPVLTVPFGCQTPPASPISNGANLDYLRVMVCSEEKIYYDKQSQPERSNECLQAAKERLSELNVRVLDNPSCPSYASSPSLLGRLANQEDVDFFVMMQADVRLRNKWQNSYSFEAEGRGKIVQISGNELLATKSVQKRGKREFDARRAAISTLQVCGKELAELLADAVVVKAGRGPVLRRVRISGIWELKDVQKVVNELSAKEGIERVFVAGWDRSSQSAVIWIRCETGVMDRLATYLEELKSIKLEVKRMDQTEVETRKKIF